MRDEERSEHDLAPPPPAMVLAFANDWADSGRFLRDLLEEGKRILEELKPLSDGGLRLRPPIHNATIANVIGAFRDGSRKPERICIFHFGGHADSATMLFEDATGGSAPVPARGLAGYLGLQPNLVLVFLNGCCTAAHVQALRAAGVKAVVATTQDIADNVAGEFAAAFYASSRRAGHCRRRSTLRSQRSVPDARARTPCDATSVHPRQIDRPDGPGASNTRAGSGNGPPTTRSPPEQT